MTGAYVRVRRGDGWANVEFDQMTDAELEAFCERSMTAGSAADAAVEGWKWAKFLARWIRDNIREEE